MPFIIEEAKGTRHEEQIRTAEKRLGGHDQAVMNFAAKLNEDQCAILVTAPDSLLRATAIAALPERQGK